MTTNRNRAHRRTVTEVMETRDDELDELLAGIDADLAREQPEAYALIDTDPFSAAHPQATWRDALS